MVVYTEAIKVRTTEIREQKVTPEELERGRRTSVSSAVGGLLVGVGCAVGTALGVAEGEPSVYVTTGFAVVASGVVSCRSMVSLAAIRGIQNEL
ncbi:MAG: hypothetical protein ACI9T8_000142 [Candidatus Saccharimonadales bacterium]